MGQALVGHAGSVGTTGRHEHCLQVSLAGTPPCEPTIGPRAGGLPDLADAAGPNRLPLCDPWRGQG